MSYYMTISNHNLKYKKDISDKINKYTKHNDFYLPWNHGKGYMDLDETYFKWDNNFLRDLLVLKNMGVRGHITCYGEEGEYMKYELADEGVEEYCGSVVFPKKPAKIIKSEDDLKKLEF